MQDQKTFTTPENKTLVVKGFLTARERNALRAVYLNKMKLNSDGSQSAEGIGGDIVELAERKLVEVGVVSYDGKSEGIVEILLNGSPVEYDYVVEKASELNKSFQKAK